MGLSQFKPVLLALDIALLIKAKVMSYELVFSARQVVNLIISIAKVTNSVFHDSVFLCLDSILHFLRRNGATHRVILVTGRSEIVSIEAHYNVDISKTLRCPCLNPICSSEHFSRKCLLC
jgi:hypothetical protein